MTTKKKKSSKRRIRIGKRRHLNPAAVFLLAGIVLAVYLCFAIPKGITNSKLRKLGYSKETITEIRDQKLQKTLLKEGYYSEYLESCIILHNVNKDYLELYTLRTADNPLTDEDFLLYNRLKDIGYEEDQLLNLFEQLKYRELTPLLALSWQWDETDYVSDCIAHRDENSADSFTLSGEYLQKYKNTVESENPGEENALVNYLNSLPEVYAPTDLEVLSEEIAVPDMQLRAVAADAADDMIRASVSTGVPFYVTYSYNSYSDQDYTYQLQLVTMTPAQVDEYYTRAGFSEHQTGLAINIVPTYESVSDFENTQVFQWLKENAASFGFIQRYPSGKSTITGMEDEENHFRYLGKKLAAAVTASGLTYDEYYSLYLKPWNNDANIPSEAILNSTGCTTEASDHPIEKQEAEVTPSPETEESAEPEETPVSEESQN